MSNEPQWAFIEIADMTDSPDPLLPGYHDQEDEAGNLTPWTWQAWCDQPTKAATLRGGKIYIGAATFAQRSQRLTQVEHDALTQWGIVLIHQDDLPPAPVVESL
jgi:hypothetical protein